MRNLLSDSDIKAMRAEIGKDSNFTIEVPPDGREYWSVHRIVDPLEYFADIEIKYNKIMEDAARWHSTGASEDIPES